MSDPVRRRQNPVATPPLHGPKVKVVHHVDAELARRLEQAGLAVILGETRDFRRPKGVSPTSPTT